MSDRGETGGGCHIGPTQDYEILREGDVIHFPDGPETYIVTRVERRPGRSGLGGMDMGSPVTTNIWIGDEVIHYDPWRGSECYQPFVIISREEPGPSVQASKPFQPAWKFPVRDVWGNRK